MRERPILFSAPMVRAILAGNKTQTRRVIPTKLPYLWGNIGDGYAFFTDNKLQGEKGKIENFKNRYGQIGNRLWVKETYTIEWWYDEPKPQPTRPIRYHPAENEFDSSYWMWPWYRATDPTPELYYEDDENQEDEPRCKWVPSILMPRWASRILLEIVNIRVERVQEISYSPYLSDVIEEGIEAKWFVAKHVQVHHPLQILEDYKTLWDSINFKRGFGWDTNPWVWVIKFKRIEENHG